MTTKDEHQLATSASEPRFAFGRNWRNFLETVDRSRIDRSKEELCEMLQLTSLQGKRFLDVGCGSGLSSLAAYELGADVVSFDYDAESVACTEEMQRRFAADSTEQRWAIQQASALDGDFLEKLGEFDIVYSWGVLHHTGEMDRALQLIQIPVRQSGQLFIAIYNDQGWQSRGWMIVKRIYCANWFGRAAVLSCFLPYFFLRAVVVGTLKYGLPWGEFQRYRQSRGMSLYYDWIDWLGGYPFEVATVDQLLERFDRAGFRLRKLKSTNRLGCNQLVFERVEPRR